MIYFKPEEVKAAKAKNLITLQESEDPKIIPLIELAKQDYRTALLLKPDLWDARYNLELALNIVPEEPVGDGLFDKPIINMSKSIESVGFKVELP